MSMWAHLQDLSMDKTPVDSSSQDHNYSSSNSSESSMSNGTSSGDNSNTELSGSSSDSSASVKKRVGKSEMRESIISLSQSQKIVVQKSSVGSSQEDRIKALETKITENVLILTNPSEHYRPYCNSVLVKLPRSEIMKMPTRNTVEYEEQWFKLSQETTFQQLLHQCCQFWGLTQEDFSLFGQKFENIMCLNIKSDHPAHRVSSFFELLRLRYPQLYLLRPDLEETKIKPVQKLSSKIKSNSKAKTANKKDVYDLDQKKLREEGIKKKNHEDFLKKYPGQASFDISEINKKQ